MSGISSGIGLISGIDIASLIDQLMAIERQPVNNLEQRVGAIDVQRAALLELSAQLLAIQNSVLGMGRSSFFRAFSSTSTNESVLTATASETAAPGTHTFRVRSLVSSHSLISRGFADADTTPVGAGTLTFEMGHGRVDPSTRLETLRGGMGVRRGMVTITDRSGASAEIDLRTAVTIDDVLTAINSNTATDVRASVTGVASNGVTGDRIVIEDLSGGTGNLIIADTGGGMVASDLGVAVNVAADRVDGVDLVRLSRSTPLSALNDENGVGRFANGPDLKFSTLLGDFDVSFSNNLALNLDTDLRVLNSGNGVRLGTIRITDHGGATADIDLSNAVTVRDVLDALNAADVAISATVVTANDDSHFLITDASNASGEDAGTLTIEDVTGFTAADLGIASDTDEESIQGHDVYRIETIGDVINAINYASGNIGFVKASISADGNGIALEALGRSDTGASNTLTVTAGVLNGVESTAARDLGLLDAVNVATYESPHLIAGLNTVLLKSLNGGRGIDKGEIRLTDRAGQTTTIDLSNAWTLQDVIDLINADDATSLVASVNHVGNGISLGDESGGTGQLIIEDVNGTTAADLGIVGSFDQTVGETLNGGNLQLQYISRQTLLSELNGGRGVATGTFRITDSTGTVHAVTIDSRVTTVGGVIDRINGTGASHAVEARITYSGDGIVIVDATGGTLSLKIEDLEGDRTAADLRLVGQARAGESFIDGSFEIRIDVGAADTLQSLARKINEANGDFSASIVNHGGALNPYSLTITSELSGLRGELLVDSLDLDLNLTTLSRAQDAVLTIGGDDGSNPVVVTSPTNTIDDVVTGVTLNLLSASDEPVTISVVQDVDSMVEAISTFVETYNGAMDAIDRDTSFNSDTFEKGPLFGDPTVNLVRDRLNRVMVRRFEGFDSTWSFAFSIGLRLGEGNRLEFDEEQFRQAYEDSPQQVEAFFTKEETGFVAVLQDTLEELTRDFDGVISRKDDLLSDQQELLNDRIESLNVLLEAKRARLEAQFVALESALAALQAQQSALNSLAQLGE